MDNFLRQHSCLLTNDVDFLSRVKLSSILDAFQEIAAEHAEKLNCGYDYMSKNNMFWVLSRVKFEIASMPKYKDSITIETWPILPKNVFFERDYLIKNSNGVMIKGTSVWCVLDIKKQNVIPAKNLQLMNIDYKDSRAIDSTAGKIIKRGDFINHYERKIRVLDLDINSHVNNTRYADFMFEGLDDKYMNRDISSMQINYIKQVMNGSNIIIEYYAVTDDILYIQILCDSELMCSGEIVFS